ncbi:MAG TPA: aspartate dehydrogenase domain-containing protein, partial [Acidimicrobiales bacterium]
LRRGQVPGCRLTGVLRRSGPASVGAARPRPGRGDPGLHPVASIDELVRASDVVVEAAGAEALAEHGPAVVEAGVDLLVVSVGALVDDALRARLCADDAGGPGSGDDLRHGDADGPDQSEPGNRHGRLGGPGEGAPGSGDDRLGGPRESGGPGEGEPGGAGKDAPGSGNNPRHDGAGGPGGPGDGDPAGPGGPGEGEPGGVGEGVPGGRGPTARAGPGRGRPRARGRVLLSTGAIGGLDLLRAAALMGPVHSVRLTTAKRPEALERPWMTDVERRRLHEADGPVTVFTGTARDAVRRFPESANVAATLALATTGLDATWVELVARAGAARVQHRIEVEADAGRYELTVENTPSANPRTSAVTAYAVLRALGDLSATVVVGV